MNFTDSKYTFGWIASTLAIIYNIPQIYRIYKMKSTRDISTYGYIIKLLSYILYLTHGAIIKDPSALVCSAINLLQILTILAQIRYYKVQIITQKEYQREQTNQQNNHATLKENAIPVQKIPRTIQIN